MKSPETDTRLPECDCPFKFVDKHRIDCLAKIEQMFGTTLNPVSQAPAPAFDKRKPDGNANNRKPRVYADTNKPTIEMPYPLDFCVWMQTNFDEVVELNNSVASCPKHDFLPHFDKDVRECRCGLLIRDYAFTR